MLIPTSAGSIVEATVNVARAFPDATPVHRQSNTAPAAPSGDTPPVCDHGMARGYKEGTSAAGKAWKAWMCPMPKGQSCSPTWIR